MRRVTGGGREQEGQEKRQEDKGRGWEGGWRAR